MTLLWNELPVSVKERIVTGYETDGLGAAETLAETLGLQMTGINLQRRIQEHRRFAQNAFRDEDARTMLTSINALTPVWDQPVVETHQAPAALTDITHIDLDTDQGPWLEWLHDAAAGKHFITVMHACDIHFPFQFDPALEVFYQMAKHIQPDVIVVGSDAADFALISTFEQDADLIEATDDVLDEFERHWNLFVRKVQHVAPHAQLVFIWGNHERRIHAFLNRQAPKFRKRLLRDFITIIRAGGAVAYVGYTDYVRVGPLVVHHGSRTGFYAAKNSLLDAGSQVSMMGGHVHYPSEYEIRGEEHTVKSVISGCLCDYPHYMEGERMTKPWSLGTAVGDVDLRSRDVDLTNVTFKRDVDTLWARYERQVFKAPIIVTPGQVTYEEYLALK